MSSALPPDLLYFTERGSGPPLLLVHGLLITGEMFEPVMDRLSIRHRVIVPDLRGHGRSRKLQPPYSAAQLSADLSTLLQHMGIGSAAVLGYSQGGAIAQQLVLDHPELCSQLILACTYAFNMATFREKLEGHLVPSLIRLLGMRRFSKLIISRGLGSLDRDRAQWIISLIADQDCRMMVSAWKEAMAFDSRNSLAKINRPTLIVAAANDTAVPFHHAKMLHEGIPDSRLVIVEGANHALIWTHPEELVRVTEEFLQSGY